MYSDQPLPSFGLITVLKAFIKETKKTLLALISGLLICLIFSYINRIIPVISFYLCIHLLFSFDYSIRLFLAERIKIRLFIGIFAVVRTIEYMIVARLVVWRYWPIQVYEGIPDLYNLFLLLALVILCGVAIVVVWKDWISDWHKFTPQSL